MPLVFSNFYPLDRLVRFHAGGRFSLEWNRSYVRHWSGKSSYMQPDEGSGISLARLKLVPDAQLPADIQALSDSTGLMYVLASCAYPILYVGITVKDMRNGMFGASGRVTHHSRKLLAAAGCATNHTGGWLEHAVARYSAVAEVVHNGFSSASDLESLAPHLWGDWRIAIAQVASPARYEGFVLEQFKPLIEQLWGDCASLNTATTQCEPIAIELPPNWRDMAPSASDAPMPVPPLIQPDADEANELEPSAPEEGEPGDADLRTVCGHEAAVARMPPVCREHFVQLLAWARSLNRRPNVQEKTVAGYGKQPAGYNGMPMVVFAEINSAGRVKPNAWLCRIPLDCGDTRPMTIVLNAANRGPVDDDEITCGQDRNFRPNDIDDFLRRPGHYTTLA